MTGSNAAIRKQLPDLTGRAQIEEPDRLTHYKIMS